MDEKSLYSSTLQKLPAPKFIVFFNGSGRLADFTYQEDVAYLKLSDAYESKQAEPDLELKVMVYNINAGHNQKLMEQCQILAGYSAYVARVRKYAAQMPLSEAVEKAVTECIREGILADFLRKNRAEVIKVSIFEYDKEKEEKKLRKAEYEAGWKDGQSEGLNIGLSKGIITMGKRFGLSEEAIINELQETLSCDKKTAIKYIRMENDD